MKPIIALVHQILTIRHADPNADISGLQQKVDRLVPAVYGIGDDK